MLITHLSFVSYRSTCLLSSCFIFRHQLFNLFCTTFFCYISCPSLIWHELVLLVVVSLRLVTSCQRFDIILGTTFSHIEGLPAVFVCCALFDVNASQGLAVCLSSFGCTRYCSRRGRNTGGTGKRVTVPCT